MVCIVARGTSSASLRRGRDADRRAPRRQVGMLLQHVVGRRIECCREGVHVVRHKTILDTLVLVSAGTPWTTPPGGTSVIPASAHPRGEARRREEAVEPPAYRRDLRLRPLHDRDDRGRSAGNQGRKDCRQTGL